LKFVAWLYFDVIITILKKVIPLLICFFIVSVSYSQIRYSIDVNSDIERRVSLRFFITQTAESFKTNRAVRIKKRISTKESAKIRKHIYRIQTRETKKRMHQSVKKADYFNSGKIPIYVKLNKMLKNG